MATSDEGVTLIDGLLRARRDALAMSITDLAAAVNLPRSYLHDCEAGRKFPSRQLVERLANLKPVDRGLLLAYHRAAFERSAERKRPLSRLTSELAHQIRAPEAIDEPPCDLHAGELPDDFTALSRRRECLQLAFDLIASAPNHPCPPGEEAVLVVYAPSLERSDLPWDKAVLGALKAGWTVLHVLAPEPEPDQGIARVRSLLALVGHKGAYIPVVLSASMVAYPSAEVVVVPGRGVLQMYSAAGSGSYFPWRPPYDAACRNLARDAFALRARATQLLTVIEARDAGKLPAKVVFDSALTDAIVRGGRRVLMKNGCMLSTLPPHATLKASKRLEESSGELVPLIEALTMHRLRRWEAIHDNVKERHQHFCSVPAILAYLAGDDEDRGPHLYQEHDPLYGRMPQERPDRIEHVKDVIDLLRGPSAYEVALVEDPASLPVPVDQSYWFCTDNGLFFAGYSQGGSRFVIVRDPAVINGFFQIADAVWESIPEPFRNRDLVAQCLQRLVDQAERGAPMLDRPLSYAGVM